MNSAILMLLFQIGDNLHAIDSSRVVEVIPRVSYRDVHSLPNYVTGLFNYRGTIVPAIDLCHLIRGTPSQPNLSTRVMMVSYLNRENQQLQYVGLMAEKVTKTLKKLTSELVKSGITNNESPYLNEIIIHEKSIIQYINLEQLFTKFDEIKLLMSGEQNDVYDNN
jgi:chemotaxis-related protein WspB